MTIGSAFADAARAATLWGVALSMAGAATAGPPAPAAPAPAPQVLIDPNAPEAATAPAAQAAAPVDPVKVEQGKRMYKDFCQKCHGVDMVSPGGGFFDLRTFPRGDKARFVESVTKGKRAMPAWGGVLKPEDIDTVWAYVSGAGAPR
jgi:mono/diheme cytochrome c family protein